MSDKLAIDGGAPVRTAPWPAWPRFDEHEETALLRVLRSGNWWQFAYGGGVEPGLPPEGEPCGEVTRFQHDFAQAHGCRYGVAAANGTATLELALRAKGIGPGDEVIVPPYTFIATASSVLSVGAVPVFADLHPGTWNLDPGQLPAALSSRTRAIIPVHFAGQAADMDGINDFAAKHGLFVLEDAAHAHGASWNGRPCGSLGDAGSFSFQNSKNMTAGEGGVLITDDRDLAYLVSSLVWAGREEGRPWYEHHRLGGNYRLTEFQGALLRVQLSRLAEQTAIRDANGRYLAGQLSARTSAVAPMYLDPRAGRISFHLFMMRYLPERCPGLTREQFVAALNAEGIPASTGYAHPIYRNPMFDNPAFWPDGDGARPASFDEYVSRNASACPVAEEACRTAIWFTQNMFLTTPRDMDDIVAAIHKIESSR